MTEEEDVAQHVAGWQAALDTIRKDYFEGCLIALRGIASGLPFETPPKYFGVDLMKELEAAGLIRRFNVPKVLGRHTALSAPGPYVLTAMGAQAIEDDREGRDDR